MTYTSCTYLSDDSDRTAVCSQARIGDLNRDVIIVQQWPHALAATRDVLSGERAQVRIAVQCAIRMRGAIVASAVRTAVALGLRRRGRRRRHVTQVKDGSGGVAVQLFQLVLQAALDAVVAELAATAARVVAHADVERATHETQVCATLTRHGAGIVVEWELVANAEVLLRRLEEVPALLHRTLGVYNTERVNQRLTNNVT